MKAKIKTNVFAFHTRCQVAPWVWMAAHPWQIHMQTMPPETSQWGSTHPEQHHSINTYSVYNTRKGEKHCVVTTLKNYSVNQIDYIAGK